MSLSVFVRNVDIDSDIQGIREAHGADEHWGSEHACYLSQKTRLQNGFFIQVAICDGKIVGHAEWVISHEPACRFLYLGMLQVHSDHQKRGIGTKLIESGVRYARDNNCSSLRTMPNLESGSMEFYQKNGFVRTGESNSTLRIRTTSSPAIHAVRIDKVPFDVVKALPLLIGLYQHASAHIWNVYNARSENDDRTVSSYRIGEPGVSYVNIGAFEPTDHASVVCWSEEITPSLITEVLAIGGSLGYQYLDLCVMHKNVPCFDSLTYEMSEDHDIFIERRL